MTSTDSKEADTGQQLPPPRGEYFAVNWNEYKGRRRLVAEAALAILLAKHLDTDAVSFFVASQNDDNGGQSPESRSST